MVSIKTDYPMGGISAIKSRGRSEQRPIFFSDPKIYKMLFLLSHDRGFNDPIAAFSVCTFMVKLAEDH